MQKPVLSTTSTAQVRHRGGEETADTYLGIPIDASPGLHELVARLLVGRVPRGARIVDLGAGRGALSQRLRDAEFEVCAFDLDVSEWRAEGVECHPLDLDADLGPLAAVETWAAICALDVIEHLENPRAFLRRLVPLARARGAVILISTPNPVDTFSCISMFTRGTFAWFSRDHYAGGGHISILPFWLLDEHVKSVGAEVEEWHFLAKWRHPNPLKQALYKAIVSLRHALGKDRSVAYAEGQTVLAVIRP